MDTSELLRRAWEAVEKSGVPESLHDAAFREAVEDLRASEGGDSSPERERQQGERSKRGGARRRGPSSTPRGGAKAAAEETTPSVDEGTFFTNLAHESGVSEDDLRDVLSLSAGKVHVTPATRTSAQIRRSRLGLSLRSWLEPELLDSASD